MKPNDRCPKCGHIEPEYSESLVMEMQETKRLIEKHSVASMEVLISLQKMNDIISKMNVENRIPTWESLKTDLKDLMFKIRSDLCDSDKRGDWIWETVDAQSEMITKRANTGIGMKNI